jgi:4-hydroxybenzoate polyprenyltransferase
MSRFFRLVRLPNLLVVALTQVLVYYWLILPAFKRHDIESQTTRIEFWLLVLACVLVTAAGYVVNDILDAASDSINRPGKNPVYQIGLDRCRWLFVSFVLIGYFISLYLALSLQQSSLLWLYPFAISLLTLYSRYIKPVPILGNLLVAVFCAGVPALIALAELQGLRQLWPKESAMIRILLIYGLFAFLATWLRELVKDLQDVKGDSEIGRRTVPIIWGIRTGKAISLLLIILNVLALLSPIALGWTAFKQPALLICLGVMIAALLFFGLQIARSNRPESFGRISTQLKFFFLAGLGLLMLV